MGGVIIVAGDEDTALAADALALGLARLGPSGRLVMFGQHMQPLAARQGAMRADSGFVDVRLTQLFTREYQVLPQRTHPIMSAEAMLSDGFLLAATKVVEMMAEGSPSSVAGDAVVVSRDPQAESATDASGKCRVAEEDAESSP